jgi:hypothetical protein
MTLGLTASACGGGPTYDVVIHGGRVMDPLTRTDVFANVGIDGGTIAAIVPADEPLAGDTVIDATGLVVAPGFINVHGHEGLLAKTMEEGLRLISDVHPYDAFNTSAAAPVFQDGPPISEQLALLDRSISDIKVQNTVVMDGEVFMESLEPFSSIEQFKLVRDKVRAGDIPDPGLIGHFYPEHMIRTWMQAPFVMMESDGAVEVDAETGEFTTHPRIAGTFSKFLGHWVREQGVCDLMTALAKSSTMAAVWLGLDGKGRVQVGADADLVLFDPETVIDTATYRADGSLNPPEGIPHVLVNGVPVVRDGQLTGEQPGRIIRRTGPVPGEVLNLGVLPGSGVESLVGVR